MLLKKNAETLENMAMKQIRLIEDAFVIDLAVQLVLALQARIAQNAISLQLINTIIIMNALMLVLNVLYEFIKNLLKIHLLIISMNV